MSIGQRIDFKKGSKWRRCIVCGKFYTGEKRDLNYRDHCEKCITEIKLKISKENEIL